MNQKISIKSIIALVAAAIGIIATFLPWVSAQAYGIVVTARGTDGDGWISLILFAIIAVIALISIKKEFSTGIKIAITILGLLALFVVISKFSALSKDLTLGIGVYLALIASIADVAAPWLPIKQ